jgi:septal ring factor EnvC (AmiA/AmiB activator)
MSRTYTSLGAVLLLITTACLTFPVPADELEDNQRRLEALRDRIGQIQKDVSAKQSRKLKAERAVREVERSIGQSLARIRSIERRLAGLNDDLERLYEDRTASRAALASQRQRLAQEVRGAYAMGHQRKVKLLLNQERPSLMGRALVYFGYFGRARAASLGQTREALKALQELESRIEVKSAELDELRDKEVEHRRVLKQRAGERQAVVDALGRELRGQGGRLAQMRNDEASLKTLISSIMEALADIPAASAGGNQAFGGRKGRLGWPARGHLSQRFGTRQPKTGLTSRGVFIESREGDSVRAISSGRVAFADWLRGFGLLLILDHGDGYMSLYGHNQAIYKDVGERVGEGEVIAAVGRSGGYSTPGLYFELRRKGRPVDPLAWCAGKPGSG